MKKKIILIIVASFMLMGVVSAASLWGDYYGNRIIRLTVNNNPVKVSDVPAISYGGRTMIPIYLLKEAGVNYTWDQKNQTVNIIPIEQKQSTQQTSTGFKISDISKEMKKVNVEYVEYASDGNGFNSITFYYNYSFDSLINDNATFDTIILKSLDTDAGVVKIVDIVGNSLAVTTSIVRDYYNGAITSDQFIKNAKFDGPDFKSNANTPTINPAPSGGSTTSTTINSKIDGDFEGFENEKIFKLQNGQIWQQTSYDYKYSYKYSPKVTIYKDGSSYYMIVDGVDKKVKVTQLK